MNGLDSFWDWVALVGGMAIGASLVLMGITAFVWLVNR